MKMRKQMLSMDKMATEEIEVEVDRFKEAATKEEI